MTSLVLVVSTCSRNSNKHQKTFVRPSGTRVGPNTCRDPSPTQMWRGWWPSASRVCGSPWSYMKVWPSHPHTVIWPPPLTQFMVKWSTGHLGLCSTEPDSFLSGKTQLFHIRDLKFLQATPAMVKVTFACQMGIYGYGLGLMPKMTKKQYQECKPSPHRCSDRV